MKKHRQGTEPKEVLSLVDNLIVANKRGSVKKVWIRSRYKQKHEKNNKQDRTYQRPV